MTGQNADDMRKEFAQQGIANVRVNLDGGITVYSQRKTIEAYKWLLEQEQIERSTDRKIAQRSARWTLIGGVFAIVAAVLAIVAIFVGRG